MDATAGGHGALFSVYLVRRKHRDFRPCLDVPITEERLAYGFDSQTRRVVFVDDHQSAFTSQQNAIQKPRLVQMTINRYRCEAALLHLQRKFDLVPQPLAGSEVEIAAHRLTSSFKECQTTLTAVE